MPNLNSKEHQRPLDGHKASCIFIDLLIIEQRYSITTPTLQNIFIYMWCRNDISRYYIDDSIFIRSYSKSTTLYVNWYRERFTYTDLNIGICTKSEFQIRNQCPLMVINSLTKDLSGFSRQTMEIKSSMFNVQCWMCNIKIKHSRWNSK